LPASAFADELAKRLVEEGVPLWRFSTALMTKHPETFVVRIEWSRTGGTAVDRRPYAMLSTDLYVGSPAEAIRSGVDRIRLRLDSEEAEVYAVTRELRERGGTDYLAFGIPYADGNRTWASWTTDVPDGFSAGDTARIESIRAFLALHIELRSAEHVTQSLLEVYLGRNAAKRVLAGKFRRGTGELSTCAIAFSDMRGFTSFADQRSPLEVVEMLDAFFEAVAGPIQEAGGEILKFIGDAVLAVFPVEDDARAACRTAFAAANKALEAVAELNGARAGLGASPLQLGMALHLGEVMYGNIGSRERLDFTVIGAAVNEASRIEGLCKEVGASLLLSSSFVEALGAGDQVASAGTFPLKGVGHAVEVFTSRRT
jgi:adenylate cyclase